MLMLLLPSSLLLSVMIVVHGNDAILSAHSFTAPFISGPNAANNRNQLEHHWKISGTADIHNNYIRLTTEKPSRRGRVNIMLHIFAMIILTRRSME